MAIKLTKQQQQIVVAGALGLGAFAFCYIKFFMLPVFGKTAEVNKKIEALAVEIDSAKRQAARLPDLEKQLVLLNERKVEAEKRLPKTKSIPEILVALGAVAEKHRVFIGKFTPGPSKSQQYFTEMSFPVDARGTYHNLGRFFAALALEQRLYNIYNVVFNTPSESTGEMAVSFELAAYQYKEG
ncbi:MAG: type 4a pilus biogenesis protein PilO [Elusimicrobia bacterium]|nr:type 4a pilus biogenesis protein PilO [Elusimicrobiota bacterium]